MSELQKRLRVLGARKNDLVSTEPKLNIVHHDLDSQSPRAFTVSDLKARLEDKFSGDGVGKGSGRSAPSLPTPPTPPAPSVPPNAPPPLQPPTQAPVLKARSKSGEGATAAAFDASAPPAGARCPRGIAPGDATDGVGLSPQVQAFIQSTVEAAVIAAMTPAIGAGGRVGPRMMLLAGGTQHSGVLQPQSVQPQVAQPQFAFVPPVQSQLLAQLQQQQYTRPHSTALLFQQQLLARPGPLLSSAQHTRSAYDTGSPSLARVSPANVPSPTFGALHGGIGGAHAFSPSVHPGMGIGGAMPISPMRAYTQPLFAGPSTPVGSHAVPPPPASAVAPSSSSGTRAGPGCGSPYAHTNPLSSSLTRTQDWAATLPASMSPRRLFQAQESS